MSYLRKIDLKNADWEKADLKGTDPAGADAGQAGRAKIGVIRGGASASARTASAQAPLILENPTLGPASAGPATRPAFPGGIAEGASVRTPCGLRRVEMVRPGDLIVTRDNGLQPVRRVWKRVVSPARINADRALAPVCLLPRALGPMLPQNRVLLAPDQRVLVPGYRVSGQESTAGCLVRACDLAAGCDDAYIDFAPGDLRLFTLVFDSHQVFCANGLPVESFLANATGTIALAAHLRAELLHLFPRLKRQPHAYPRVKYRVVDAAKFLPDRL